MRLRYNATFGIFLALYCINVSGQSRDLADLAFGEFLSFYSISDADNDLFGYVTCYELGIIDENLKTVECRVFDKNLNSITEVEFKAEIAIDGYYPYFNHKRELILYPNVKKDSRNNDEFTFPESRKWDLDNNLVSVYRHYCFEDEKLIMCRRSKSKEQKENERERFIREHGFALQDQIVILEDSSIVVNTWEDHYYQKQLQYISNVHFYKYNKGGALEWVSPLSEEGKPEDFIFGRMLYRGVDFIYFMAIHYYDYKIASIFLIGINSKTGERVFLEDVSKNYDYFNVDSGLPEIVQEAEGKVHFIGRKKDIQKNQVGYYSMIIDKETQNLKGRFMPFEALKGDLKKVNRNGRVGKGYYLELREGFVFKDGSCALVTEKSNSAGLAFKKNNLKTRDFVVILLDDDFTISDAHLVEKDKSTNPFSDLLYTEYLEDGSAAAFFYRDYRKDDETKDKNWVLGINTIIDGVYRNEEIPMSSDEFFISPYRAKEGYILLREFDLEKGYNTIRLERLNY